MTNQSGAGSIVMTGGTAGFGRLALDIVSQNSDQPIILGARDASKLPPSLRDRITVLDLDLNSFRSVRDFCERASVVGPINSLVLNAGLSSRTSPMTEDGFERTFQVNYLSHFAMIQRLWDVLKDDAQIVITSSGTHDPEEKTPPPPPRHANARLLADPSSDPTRDKSGSRAAARAYTSSKLCCTMLSLELAERRPAGTSISFDPGLVPGTQLTREFPQWLVRLLLPIMSRTMPADRTSSLAASANGLAYLMARRSLVGASGDYVAMRGGSAVVVQPSEMARDAALRRQLWADSEALLANVAALT